MRSADGQSVARFISIFSFCILSSPLPLFFPPSLFTRYDGLNGTKAAIGGARNDPGILASRNLPNPFVRGAR